MKEETITKYIDQLAQSLNVASEHVYEALLKQAMVSGIVSALVAALALGIIIVLSVIVFTLWKRALNEDHRMYDTEEASFHTVIIAVFVGVATFVFVGCAYDALTALLNPEYWAIKEVLNAVKN